MIGLDLAGRGWPVFPLRGKVPAVAGGRGVLDATTDPEVIREWARVHGSHSWGIACGPAGLVVIDLDAGKAPIPGTLYGDPTPPGVVDGADVLAVLAERHGADGSWLDTLTVRTPSGGTHLYYQAPTDIEVRCSAGKLGPMVDVRASGGYVVAAGSRTSAGRYEEIPGPVRPLPAWLQGALERTGHVPGREPQRQATRPAPAVLARPRGYVATVIERELDAVATAAPGTRNTVLNRSAFNIGTLVDTYGLDLRGTADALLAAALHAGLGDREARAAIRSGLHAGRQHPRRAS